MALPVAYHLHMSQSSPEESYHRNKEIGDYGSKVGDLDVAERSDVSAISDIKQVQTSILKNDNEQSIPSKEMHCLMDLASNVYYKWGRYNEALLKYQLVLQYTQKVDDPEIKLTVLNNVAMIHEKKGEYDQALRLYNQSLEIAEMLDDQYGIGQILNNISMIHDKEEKKI